MAEDGKTTEKSARDEATDAAEKRLLDAGDRTILEMKDAMVTMMDASTKMMQAWLDMRLSFLKAMRLGLDDPKSTFEMMARNAADLAKAMKDSQRKD